MLVVEEVDLPACRRLCGTLRDASASGRPDVRGRRCPGGDGDSGVRVMHGALYRAFVRTVRWGCGYLYCTSSCLAWWCCRRQIHSV